MILAAGLGTRLKPYTDSTPKALIEIKGFPLLKLQIRKLSSEGFDQIIINVHHLSDQVKEFIKQNIFFNCSFTISDESKKLLNTGGALKKAAHFFSDRKPFLVYNVDILSDINLKSLMNQHPPQRHRREERGRYCRGGLLYSFLLTLPAVGLPCRDC